MTHLAIHPPTWLLLSLAVAGLLAAATLWLYVPQVLALTRAWRTLLPGLRLAALAALAASVFRPSVLRPRAPAELGAVVILEDASASMSVIDAPRPAQTLDIAEAIGLLHHQPWDAALAPIRSVVDELQSAQQEAIDARADLDYARLAGHNLQQAEERERAAADRLRNVAGEVARHAAGFPRARPLVKSAGDLVDLMADRPSNWLRQSTEYVARVAAALENLRNSAAEELLGGDDREPAEASRIVSTMSRRQLAEQAIVSREAGLLAALDPQTPIFAFRFGQELRPFVPRAIDAVRAAATMSTTSAATSARTTTSTLRPIADADPSTDLAGALSAVNERLRGHDLRAIVLFSDGRQVSAGRSGASDAGSIVASRAPVLAVQCARGLLRDRSIVRVSAPSSLFAGETATVRVEVRSVGMRDEAVDVTLDAPGAPRQIRRVDLADDRATAEFTTKLQGSGVQRIAVAVSPSAAEVTSANNRAERLIKVLSGKISVALVSGSATPEYRYLRDALSRTPFVKLTDANGLSGSQVWWAMSPQQIAQQDVIVLCDVGRGAVSDEQWQAIRAAVIDRGASVMFLCGAENFPSGFAANDAIGELLPWTTSGASPSSTGAASASAPRAWQSFPGEDAGFRVVPGVDGERVESLRLADDSDANRRRWEQLPGLFRYVKLPPLRPGVRKLLVERASGDPLLTEQRVGAGRAFVLATDETWRMRAGERDQDRFWLQLMRYASEEPYAAEAHGLALDADPVTAEPLAPIRIRARLLDADGRPLAIAHNDAPPRVDVLRVDGSLLRSEPLEPTSVAGRYQAGLDTLPAGEYTLRLRVGDAISPRAAIPRDTAPVPTASPAPASPAPSPPALPAAMPSIWLTIAPNGEAEMSDLSPDDANLRRIAAASGGQVLRLDEMPSLPEKLAAVRETTRPVEYRLWDSPYLFLFVLGCLGAEWAVRKRVGLA